MSEKIHKITIKRNGYDMHFEVVILDSSHFKYRSEFCQNYTCAQHIAQLSDEMHNALFDLHLIKDRFFIIKQEQK